MVLTLKVQTVLGTISPDELGITLPHEHLLIDLRCAYREPEEVSERALSKARVEISNLYQITRDPYINEDALTISDVELAAKEVEHFKLAGGSSIVDLTLPGIGRDPVALKRIAEATGLNITMGTGFYTEASHPAYIQRMDSDQIAEGIVKEIEVGVDDSGIRAGIIGEIGCSWTKEGSVTAMEDKVLRAAARAHLKTHAPINVHPYFLGRAALIPLKVLKDEGVDLHRVAVSHLDVELDVDFHRQVAQTGARIEYDCFGVDWTFDRMPYPPPGRLVDCPKDSQRIEALKKLIQGGYMKQLLISHDVCMKIYLKRYGGHGYDHILKRVLPMMRAMGIDQKQIETLLIDNPADFLAH